MMQAGDGKQGINKCWPKLNDLNAEENPSPGVT